MRRSAPAKIPTDPRDWRPQVARTTNRPIPIIDPIVEPLWTGTRVLAHFQADPPSLVLIDDLGDDVLDAIPNVGAELAKAIIAVDAVVDGILTTQATRSSEGASVVHDALVSPAGFLFGRRPAIDVHRDAAPRDEAVLAFVAVDLLQVDGQTLFDLPLLERKRLLDGVIAPSERVRVSPFTRPPADPWVVSWKGAGLKGAIIKAANGRYSPGAQVSDWTTITRIHQH